MKLNIFNLIIDTDYYSDSFQPFICSEGEADMIFRCTDKPFSPDCEEPIAVHNAFSVFHYDGGWLYETPDGEQLSVDKNYSCGKIYFKNTADKSAQNLRILVMLRVTAECRFASKGIVSLHSACVELNGNAVAFTGASGAGKSTRSEAWVKTLGAQWISGDRPVVNTKSMIVSGLPWDGKEQIFRNYSCPLYAVLDVRRSHATRLRRLTPAQARRVLMQQCFIPMWDTETASEIIKNIYIFAQNGTFLRLFCDRDENAAQEVCCALFDKSFCAEREETDLKIKDGFTLRHIVGEYMIMPTGDNVAEFDGSVALNDVSAFIYEKLQNPVSESELLMLILDEYDVERDVAQKDLKDVLDSFRKLGLLDEQK